MDENEIPESIYNFLFEAMYEMSGDEDILTKPQLIHFTSLAYPDKSQSDVSSMIEDLMTYLRKMNIAKICV